MRFFTHRLNSNLLSWFIILKVLTKLASCLTTSLPCLWWRTTKGSVILQVSEWVCENCQIWSLFILICTYIDWMKVHKWDVLIRYLEFIGLSKGTGGEGEAVDCVGEERCIFSTMNSNMDEGSHGGFRNNFSCTIVFFSLFSFLLNCAIFGCSHRQPI